DFAGDWLDNPFQDAYAGSGHAGNFPAFVHRLRIPAHQSRSLLHFVVLGSEATALADAGQLANAPDVTGLSAEQICSIANFALPCAAGTARRVPQPPALPAPPETTSVGYDVVGKTVDALQQAMETGAATSVEITQAYLDRIAAYDRGSFGLHAFEVVASDALKQAAAADAARRTGRRGRLLGIPVAIKNLYDTYDLPTTNGSLTFAGFRPAHDAFQVARLRAASFAAAALGTQTGDSLYAPASAASLVTLRPTDGVESGSGIMPLVWLTDTGGVLARSVGDLADMLNVVAGTDPDDPGTAEDGERLPKDWRSALDADALRG